MKPILSVLDGNRPSRPPVWMMRQAGRYLPEYRALRSKSPSFMDFCFSPSMAAEATVQPIRRFGFDAAILFSDILVMPAAFGQKVTFEQGEGPRLPPIEDVSGLNLLRDEADLRLLEPVFETVERVRSELGDKTALIGFCGAPWTVATYMIAGRGTPDQAPARLFAYRHPEAFAALLDKLVRGSVDYLERQVKAGVEVVQIFDSWAGMLPNPAFERWSLEPIKAIATDLKKRCPEVRIIAFARGVGTRMARFLECAAIDGLGIDTSEDTEWVAAHIQPYKAVQGNLDPLVLKAGGNSLEAEVHRIVDAFSGGPHIFNLGHGILPDTPINHVEDMLRYIRG